jgi:hypothetical protein
MQSLFGAPNKDCMSVGKQEEDELEQISASGSVMHMVKNKSTKD